MLHPTVSKGLALDVLCRRFGIEREHVLAFGDNVNDVEMLEFAGLGRRNGQRQPRGARCRGPDHGEQ